MENFDRTSFLLLSDRRSAGRPPCGPPGLLRRRGRLMRPGSARPATAGRRRARSRCSSKWRRWRLRRRSFSRTALRRLSSLSSVVAFRTRARRATRVAPRGHEPSAIRTRSQELLARTAADSATAAAAVELSRRLVPHMLPPCGCSTSNSSTPTTRNANLTGPSGPSASKADHPRAAEPASGLASLSFRHSWHPMGRPEYRPLAACQPPHRGHHEV